MTGAAIQIDVGAATEAANQQLNQFFQGTAQNLDRFMATSANDLKRAFAEFDSAPAKMRKVEQAMAAQKSAMAANAAVSKTLRAESMLLGQGFREVQSMVLLLGGQRFPMLTNAMIGGRAALMTLRGLIQTTGLSLGTIAPVLGVVGGALALGVLQWREYASAQERAAQATKENAQALKELPRLIGNINTIVSSGAVSSQMGSSWLERIGALPGNPFAQMGFSTAAISPTFGMNPIVNAVLGPQGPSALGGYVNTRQMKALQEDLVRQGLLINTGDEKNPNYEINPQVEALQKLKELQKKVTQEGSDGFDRERIKAKDAYEEAIKELEKLASVSGHFFKQSEFEALKKQIGDVYNSDVTGINFKQQQQKDKQAEEAFSRRQAELAKIAKEENERLELALTKKALDEGKNREDNYEYEYQQRKRLLESQLFEGVIDDKQYTDGVLQETIKRMQGRRKEAEDAIRLQDAQKAIALSKVQGARTLVEKDPNLDDQQKRGSMIGLLKEENRVLEQNIELNERRAQDLSLSPEARQNAEKALQDLQQRKAANQEEVENLKLQGTYAGELRKKINDLKNSYGELGKSMADLTENTMTRAVKGLAGALTAVIMGTKDAGQAFAQLGVQMLSSFIENILEAVLYAEIAVPILTALGVLTGGTTAAEGSVVTIAAMSAAMAAVPLARGGAVRGPGSGTSDSIFARLSNGEYVMPASRVSQYGLGVLEAMRNGVLDLGGSTINAPHARTIGGSGGGAGAINHKTELHLAQFGGEADAERWAKSQGGEVWFHDMLRRNVRRYVKS